MSINCRAEKHQRREPHDLVALSPTGRTTRHPPRPNRLEAQQTDWLVRTRDRLTHLARRVGRRHRAQGACPLSDSQEVRPPSTVAPGSIAVKDRA